jgi:transforming growth factor-beta-induced protein
MNFRSLALVALVVSAIFAVSCNQDDDVVMGNAIPAQDSELKSGKSLKPGEESIAAIAINAGFSELVGALSYVDAELNAGLVELFLNGKDQYTVFAPTNDAFTALYSALGVGGITELPADLVLNVLLYHVTDGRRAANSVVPKNGVRTIETLLEGATFSVDSKGVITAVGNEATIVRPNISASNGVIHIIDTVILPITVN